MIAPGTRPGDLRQRRSLVVLLALALAVGLTAPVGAQSSAQSAVLSATLQLPGGSSDYPIELGELHVLSQAESPFLVQVIDGCAVNGHLWVLGAGFGTDPVPLRVVDATSGRSHTLVLPAYAPDEPIEAVLAADAIPACTDATLGGLPELVGTATYTAVTPGCVGSIDPFALSSGGSEEAYRTFLRGGDEASRIVGQRTIAAIDESSAWDELHLLAEGRTPRRIEGVVLSGDEGSLPTAGRLQRGLRSLKYARVRRAFEAAKNGRSPRGLIGDLGIRGLDCVYHVSLDFETPGAAASLETAGWIRDGGPVASPPPLVEERFTVDIVQADGSASRLPLVGPVEGSDDEGLLWHFQDERARAEIVDACDLTGSFWSLGAAVTDVPVELVVTDTSTGAVSRQVLWGEDGAPAASVETSALACG